jgi:hypothetical protein
MGTYHSPCLGHDFFIFGNRGVIRKESGEKFGAGVSPRSRERGGDLGARFSLPTCRVPNQETP